MKPYCNGWLSDWNPVIKKFECGSSDNLTWYTNGDGKLFCFCQIHISDSQQWHIPALRMLSSDEVTIAEIINA